jgi:hypothetical protein
MSIDAKAPAKTTLVGFVIRFLVTTLVVVGAFLLVDPNYFDIPLASALTGLEAKDAPVGPFATAVTFEAGQGEPITLVLAGRDAPLQVQGELTAPDGRTAWRDTFSIPHSTGGLLRGNWITRNAPAPVLGTYTLRLSQSQPGRIKVYFFQGPFVARMIALPITMLIINLAVLVLAGRRESETDGANAPPSVTRSSDPISE